MHIQVSFRNWLYYQTYLSFGIYVSYVYLLFIQFIHFHALEKEMATHYSVLAWRIPGTGEPDGLPSMGSHRVRHD